MQDFLFSVEIVKLHTVILSLLKDELNGKHFKEMSR
jgi:hypothetical protein